MKSFKTILLITPIMLSIFSCGGNPSTPPVVEEKVTVTLNPNGGSISKTEVKLDKGTIFSSSLFPTPSKTDYIFLNWTFNDDSSIPSAYKIEKDITFKAKYKMDEDKAYINSLGIKHVDNTYGLYTATYNDLDYEEGMKYLDNFVPNIDNGFYTGGNCTSFRSGDFYGRNFDWTYGFRPEFIIKTPKNEEKKRHATLGISYCLDLTKDNVDKKEKAAGHKNAPFTTVDGINDAGLCASINEVDKRDVQGVNKGSNPGLGYDNLNILGVVRYVLDYAATVKEAETLLGKVNIYTPSYLNEEHIMIADSTGDTAIIEFKPKSTENDCYKETTFIRKNDGGSNYFENISTNFTFLNFDGTESTIMNHGDGIERYYITKNILDNLGGNVTSLDETLNIMKDTYYTKSYTNQLTKDNEPDFWWSEYYFYGNLNKNSDKTLTNFESIKNYYLNLYKKHSRSDGADCFYNTTHSVAYDLNKKEMKLVYEEEIKIEQVFSI